MFLGMHLAGILYLGVLSNNAEKVKDELEFRIYMFYFIIDMGVFWFTNKLLNEIIDDAQREIAIKDSKKHK